MPTAVVDRLTAEDEPADREPIEAVCPFCGGTYAAPRRRCTTCGGTPVVPPEDGRVYETVIAPCGPDCGRVATRREAASP